MIDVSQIQRFQFENIGSKTISYLAEGLYPDARDSIREYVQNAVDGKATQVIIYVSNDSIVIENDGEGMDEYDLSKSLRIAISEKDPDKNIGYKGIGIYSGLIMSQKMVIKTRKGNVFSQLSLDFGGMGRLIDQNASLPDVINKSTVIESIGQFEFFDESINGDGTQVVLTGIRSEFKDLFLLNELEKYLTNTLPLPFNPRFSYANNINDKIKFAYDQAGYKYRTIHLHLEMNGKRKTLYQPYTYGEDKLFAPHFEFIEFEINGNKTTFALIWGCLSKERAMLDKKYHRGFKFKHKGFTIGDSNTVLPYFRQREKFANRYIGEIVLLSKHIKANTARSDIARTDHYMEFSKSLKDSISNFEQRANEYQESSIALEQCDRVTAELQDIILTPSEKGIDVTSVPLLENCCLIND